MADNITSLYNIATEKHLLKDGMTEEAFRQQTSTEEGRKSFYDYAQKRGLKMRPYEEYTQKYFSQDTQTEEQDAQEQAIEEQTTEKSLAQSIGAHNPYAYQTQQAQKEQEKAEQSAREEKATLPLSVQDKEREEELHKEQVEGTWGKSNGITMGIDKQTGLPVITKTEGDGMHLSTGATPANQDRIDQLKTERPSYIAREIRTPQDLYTSVSEAWSANTEEGRKAKAELDKTTQDTYDNLLTDLNKQVADLQQQVANGTLSKEEAQRQAEQAAQNANAIYENETKLAQDYFFRQMTEANKDYLSKQTRILGQNATNKTIEDINARITPQIQQLQEDYQREVAQYNRGNRGGAYGAIGAQMSTNITRDPEKAQELELYRQSQQFLADAAKISQAAQEGHGFGKALGSALTDEDTWDFGISQLVRSVNLKNIVEKYEKGEQLTDAEKGLMDSAVAYISACAYNSDKLSRAYKAGQTTGESIPFMLQFMVMPIDAVKNKVAKGILGYGIEQFGGKTLQTAGKTATRYTAGQAFKEAGTALLGNIAAAGMQTAAFGVPKIAEGTISRMTGDITPTYDENGNIVYGGRQNKQGAAEAAWNATVDTYVENLSEMVLTTFDPLKAYVGTTKLFKGLTNSQIAQVLSRIDNSVIGKIRERAQFRNYVEEVGEEYVGNLMKWGASTDINSADEAGFSIDQQIDTWLGLAPTSILFGTANLTSGGIDLFQTSQAAKELRKIMENGEQRKYLDNLLNSKNSDAFSRNAHDVVKTILRDKSLNEEYKRFILDGIYDAYQSQLAKETEETKAQEEVEQAEEPIEQQTEPTQETTQPGQNTPQEGVERYRDKDNEEVEIQRNTDGSVAFLDEKCNTMVDEQGNAIVMSADEFNRFAADSQLTRLDPQTEQTQQIRQQAEQEVALITNKNDGKVYEVVRADDETKRGHIVSGNVEIDTTDPDALHITNNDVVTVRYEDGTVEQLPAKDLDIAGAPVTAEQAVQLFVEAETQQQPEQQPAQEQQESSAINNSTDTADTLAGKRNDTTTPQNTANSSADTGTTNNSNKQKPDIDNMDANTLGTAAVEYMKGDKNTAKAYLQAEKDKAEAEVKRLKRVKVTKYTDIDDFMTQQAELDRQKKDAADRLAKLDAAITFANAYKTEAEQQAAAVQAGQQPANQQTQPTVSSTPAGNAGETATPAIDISASDTLKQIEAEAVPFEDIDLTPENWYALFGEDGIVSTPIGDVKMGENQYLKLAQKGRDGKLGMVKPTLEHPSVIIEDKSEAKEGQVTERDYSYVFVKAFTGKNGKRIYYFASVTVSKDGKEVVVSNQEKTANRIAKLIEQNKLVWLNNSSLHPTSQVEESVPLNRSHKPTQTDSQLVGLGINPSGKNTNVGSLPAVESSTNPETTEVNSGSDKGTNRFSGNSSQTSSAGKGTTSVPNNQTSEQKSVADNQNNAHETPTTHLRDNSKQTKQHSTTPKTFPAIQTDTDSETRQAAIQIQQVEHLPKEINPKSIIEVVAKNGETVQVAFNGDDLYVQHNGKTYVVHDARQHAIHDIALAIFNTRDNTFATERIEALKDALYKADTIEHLKAMRAGNSACQKASANFNADTTDAEIHAAVELSEKPERDFADWVNTLSAEDIRRVGIGLTGGNTLEAMRAMGIVRRLFQIKAKEEVKDQVARYAKTLEQAKRVAVEYADNYIYPDLDIYGSGMEGNREVIENFAEQCFNELQAERQAEQEQEQELQKPLTLEQKLSLIHDIADGNTKVALVTNKTLVKKMTELGATRKDIAEAISALAKGDRINGFYLKGTIILNTDALNTGMDIIQTFVHERQHLLTKENPQILDSIIANTTAEQLAQLLQTIAKTSFYNVYNNGTSQGHQILADEFLSHIMQEAYATDQDADAVAQQYGITNQDILTTLHNLDYEQRQSDNLSKARRNVLVSRSSNNRGGKSSRDSQAKSNQVDGQRPRSNQSRNNTPPTGGQTSQNGVEQTLFSATNSQSLAQLNDQFNNELARFAKGEMKKNEMLHLGQPHGVMRIFLPNLPIVMRQHILTKASVSKHNVAIEALTDMPKHISQPIFVFERSKETLGILTEMKDRDDKNVCVAIELQKTIQDGGDMLEVNDIRSIHGRNVEDIVYPIVQNKTLKWCDKEKGLAYLSSASQYAQQEIDKQALDSAAKIVQNFENPKLPEENNTLFSIAGTQVVPLDDHTLVGLHNISADKLRKALKAGGLANPSAAVIDIAKQNHHGYGEISLVMPSALVDSKSGRNAGTYAGDAYTPTYPSVEHREGKETSKRIKNLLKDLPTFMQDKIARDIHYYMQGNIYNTGLPYLFLAQRGQQPAIVQNERQYPHITLRDIYDRLGIEHKKYVDADAIRDAHDKLSKDELYDFNLWLTHHGDPQEIEKWNDQLDKVRKANKDKGERAVELLKERAIGYKSYINDINAIAHDEVAAGNENYDKTVDAAKHIISEQGLTDEYNKWEQETLDNLGYEEVLFAGYTPSGNRRYLPNTIENASRLMNQKANTNSNDGEGVSETKALLMDKFKTLSDIRDHKDILEGDREKVKQTYEQTSNDWFQLGIDFRDYTLNDKKAWGLSDNPFMAADEALARLQEAMLKRNPIAYLNAEYNYSLSEDSEFGKRLMEMKERIKNLPSKYFETKFNRPVYLNEFRNAVIPNNLPQDLRDGLSQAGLGIYEYDPATETTSRREATLQATEDTGIRFSISSYTPETDNTLTETARQEMQAIRDEAITNGTYMIEPNGNSTNLTERQWLQARTKAFLDWFGDWLKAARIDKLRKSESVSITGQEITPSDNPKEYRHNALEYGKQLRGEYTNKDTGKKIIVNRDSIKEVLEHDYKDIEHLQSIAAIPQLIENSIYITSEEVENASKRLENAKQIHYYVCGLNINNVPYTAKIVIAELQNGDRYYDHKLTQIEKGDLINRAELSSTVADDKSPNSDRKDRRLFSILQTNCSKIVDENGAPLLVYHGTPYAGFSEFDNNEAGIYFSNLDRASWYTGGIDSPQLFRFAPNFNSWDAVEQYATKNDISFAKADEEEYGENAYNIDGVIVDTMQEAEDVIQDVQNRRQNAGNIYAAFLNIRNPKYKDAKGEYAVNYDQLSHSKNNDGVIIENINDPTFDEGSDFLATNYIVFSPNQIKSATDNNGSFDNSENDIRFQIIGEQGAANLDKAEEATTRLDNEQVLRDVVIDRLRENGIEVITDTNLGQSVLDEANKGIRLQAQLNNLHKAANTIRRWLANNERGKSFTIELPTHTLNMLDKVMGHDFDSHRITADGIAHAKNNHGVGGKKIEANSIPLRDEDFELAPYIMTAPDAVKQGSVDRAGRNSVRFEKRLSNGIVIVVEKENDSPNSMNLITMWADRSSSNVADARSNRTSPTLDAQDVIISSDDAAKIRKDAETAIENDEKIRENRVWHGTSADFDHFDHSHMGEGEGAQTYGWGTYVTDVEGVGREYANIPSRHCIMAMNSLDALIDELGYELELEEERVKERKERLKEERKKLAETKNDLDKFNAKAQELKEKWGETEVEHQKILLTSQYEKGKRVLQNREMALGWSISEAEEIRQRLKKTKQEKEDIPSKYPHFLYTVDIPNDNGNNYLNWDGKVGVRLLNRANKALVADGLEPIEKLQASRVSGIARGEDLYDAIQAQYANRGVKRTDEAASKLLSKAGFVGIKYPTNARNGGNTDGWSNYVIFNEADAKIVDKVRFFRTANGEAYGFTIGGKIYIDTRIANADTPIHEYAHLWATALRQNNPKEWANIVGLMKGTPLWDEVKKDYSHLTTDDEIADEVLARYSGRRGAERLRKERERIAQSSGTPLEKAKAISALERVRKALSQFWKKVADFLHIHFTTAEEVADRVLYDLLNATDLKDNTAAIADYLLSDNYAKVLTGNEFPKDETPITKKVAQYYKENYGGRIERKNFGEVILDERSVKDSIAHGIGRAKAAAFAAVPEIIRDGVQIDEQENWKGRNRNSFTFAAPVQIAEKPYVGIVIVTRGTTNGDNHFYLHEVMLQESLQSERNKTDIKADTHNGDIAKVLQKIVSAKTNPSENTTARFSVFPVPPKITGETTREWARRIADWRHQQLDQQHINEYKQLLERNQSKRSKLYKFIVDKFTAIDNFQQWIIAHNGTYDPDNMDMHGDLSLAFGRIATFQRRYKDTYIQHIADNIAAIAKDKKLNDALLNLNLKWQNFEDEKTNGRPLTIREIMGVYAQAKDTQEAADNGLPDRGAQGFINNLGITHYELIDAIENALPKETIDNFWDAVYAANQFALDYQLQAGLIDQATRDRYERRYYVPQRGWRERDFDGYDTNYVPEGARLYGNPYNSALVKAHGRQSLASDPFALIESIGLTSISQSEHNRSKQQFLNLLLANENIGLKSGAWTVRQIYAKNIIDPTTGRVMRHADGTPFEAEVVYAAPTQAEREHDEKILAQIEKLRKEQEHLKTPAAIAKRDVLIEDLQDQLIYVGRASDTMIEHRTRDEKHQHQVVVLKDGQQYLVELQDEALANAVNGNFGEAYNAYKLLNKLNTPAIRYMSGMLTQFNPRFASRNFWRDAQAALINNMSELGVKFATKAAANIPMVQRTIWAYIWSDAYHDRETYSGMYGDYLREYFEAGAQTGFSFMPELERIAKDFDKMVKGDTKWDKVWNRGIKGTLSLLTEASELTVRFAQYVTARQLGYSTQEAAKIAKNITTNFNQSGILSKEMSKYFTFFNATVQGNMREMTPQGKNRPAYGKMALKFGAKLAGVAANFALLGLLSVYLNPDDPDDETWFTEYDRMSNFIVFGTKIPVVHFFRMFYAAGVQAALAAQGRKTWKDAALTATDYALSEITPTSVLQLHNMLDFNEATNELEFNATKYAQSAAPSVVSPVVDVLVNRDFKGSTVYRKKWDEQKKNITTAKRNTPQWAIDAANTLHEWSGGNPEVPYGGGRTDGWIDIKPNAIEHIAQGYLSGVWESLGHTAGFVYDAAAGGDDYKSITNYPFLRDLFRDYSEDKAYNQEFYKATDKMEAYRKRYNSMPREEQSIERKTDNYKTYQEVERKLLRLPNPLKDDKEVSSKDINAILQLNQQLNRNLFKDE